MGGAKNSSSCVWEKLKCSDAENIRAINGHWLEILRIFTATETTTWRYNKQWFLLFGKLFWSSNMILPLSSESE